MKTYVLLPLCMILAFEAQAQTATIHHYGGTALPPGSATDTAFCKGQSQVEIHGTGFMAAPTPWIWDSITLSLGGIPLPLHFLLDTEIHTAFPDSFPAGSCLPLVLRLHAHAGATTMAFATTDTVCLVGDGVTVTYPPGPWCIGNDNPRPTISLAPGTVPGAFCCASPPGLIVLPDGEIPLHSGAAGNATWQYQSGHPQCAETLVFSALILPQTITRATIGGAIALNVCQSAPMLRADSPQPPGGRFSCDDPGLSIADDSMGLVSPRLSRAGAYVLRYTPAEPCASTATVSITVQPAPGAALEVAAACDGLPVLATASSQGLGGLNAYHWSLNGVPFVASSGWDGHEFSALQDGDSIGVVVENFFGCVDTAGVRVDVKPRPSLALAPHGTVVGLPVWEVVSSLDGTELEWRLSEHGLGTTAKSPVLLASGTAYSQTAGVWTAIEPQAALPGYQPASFSQLCLEVSAIAGGCPADTVRDCAQAVPGGGVFIPEVMTPNGDGINDVWEIRWPEQLRPEAYTLELFNRSGGRVLLMQGLKQGWDGGNYPDGVYWWTLRMGNENVDRGGLTIRRK